MDFIVFILFLNIFLFLFALGGFWGVIWLPTKRKDYDRIANSANLKPGMIFYDLGSGSGELLFYLANRYKIKCVGVEISPILYLYSKIKSLFFREVEIKYGNFFKQDLSKADVIYAFLHPKMYDSLKEKIRREMEKESTILILSTWPFKNANPLEINQKDKGTTYYLYKKANL